MARRLLFLLAAPLVAQHPMDPLLDNYFCAGKLTPPAVISDAAFARRAYLDAWGLLPTPEQLSVFVADTRPEKHQALIDSLLADNGRYTHHWITFWNDHLRNDEGVVYHGERKSITPWLRQALETNLPYDRFLQALLNPTAKTDPDGFLIGVNWRGDINASQTPVMQAAQNTAQIFLGVNLKCNSCHDSFINRWKLKDAYGLASFFSDRPLEIHRCDAATGQMSEPRFLYPELGSVDPSASLAEKLAAAARLFTMPENRRTPRTLVNRFWRVLFGRGQVEPVDDMDAKPWSPEILDFLADDFVASGHDMKHLLRRIMTSRAYRLASDPEPEAKPYVFRGPQPRRLSAEQFLDAVSSVTGEWRLLEPRTPGPAAYARDWQIKSSPLGRALGRPIRDQVITERITQPTTLQALELTNGATVSDLLHRGARRMLDKLARAPEPLFDSGVVNKQQVEVDVELAGVKRLWLVLRDVDSYDPARTVAGWRNASFGGDLFPVALPSTVVVEAPAGATRFRAKAMVDPTSLASDISPRVRFFVYREPPDLNRLMPVRGEPPVPRPPAARDAEELIARVYQHALGRLPSNPEKRVWPAPLDADSLEDMLWAVFLSPEFQFIR